MKANNVTGIKQLPQSTEAAIIKANNVMRAVDFFNVMTVLYWSGLLVKNGESDMYSLEPLSITGNISFDHIFMNKRY